jgi:hypothetical protein
MDPASSKEIDIEELVIAWAEDHGWLCPKLQWVSQTGWPDRAFMKKGKVIWIEFKRTKGGRKAKKQEYWIDELWKHGFHAMFCNSAEHAIETLKSYD